MYSNSIKWFSNVSQVVVLYHKYPFHGRNRPKSFKHIVTSPLLNARQWVSRVLGYEHYKRMSPVTVGVTRKRTLTAE